MKIDFCKDNQGQEYALLISGGVPLVKIWDKPTVCHQIDEFLREGIIVARVHTRLTNQVLRSNLSEIIYRHPEDMCDD